MQRNGRFIKLCAILITAILFGCSTKPDPLCHRHNPEESSPRCFLPSPPLTQKASSKPEHLEVPVSASTTSQTPHTIGNVRGLDASQITPSNVLAARNKDVLTPAPNKHRQQITTERTQRQFRTHSSLRDKTKIPLKTFTVQLGVYQQESSRKEAIIKLGEGFSAIVFPVKATLYGLASGVFNHRTEAEKHAELLKSIGFTDAYVRLSPTLK